jgi:hypothetical protein
MAPAPSPASDRQVVRHRLAAPGRFFNNYASPSAGCVLGASQALVALRARERQGDRAFARAARAARLHRPRMGRMAHDSGASLLETPFEQWGRCAPFEGKRQPRVCGNSGSEIGPTL